MDVVKTSAMVPLSQEFLDDTFSFREWIENTRRRVARDMHFALLGYRDPWPNAGFNPHLRTFPEPEPEYCSECHQEIEVDE